MPETRERILVVEDEETLRKNLVRYLEREGYRVESFGSAEEALAGLGPDPFDLAILDLRLPGKDGLSLASDLSAAQPDLVTVLMTAYGTVEAAVDALRVGVHDFILKPLLLKDVGHRIARLLEHRRLLREVARLRRTLADRGDEEPVMKSRAMADLYAFARQVAPLPSTVLIEGESGTGKEVVARFIHDASARRDGPFVAVNVAAIPDNLVESQLFGHEKGAFTGADSAREGFFRAATGGTLFLDEIGDLPAAQQTKLLRALETREIVPVGRDRPMQHDARIVAATNADLAKRVQEKRFRSDLYYRLAALKIRVPPLRERPEDVPALALLFLARHAKAHGRAVPGIEAAAMRRLLAYPWPGNVRELGNALERASVVSAGQDIGVAHLPPEIAGQTVAGTTGGYQEAMADFERALIRSTLEQVQGDRREAARLLGLSLATLYRRIDKLGLKEGKPEENPPEDALGEAETA
jgi:DNA-binding NtrC family response regulator